MTKTAFALALALPLAALAQMGDAKEVQIKTTQIAPGIAMLEGMGGNIGVSYGEDGVFLIDDQFAPLFGKIKAAVAALDKHPVRFVFNTHWHFDHTGGNEPMGEAGAVIVAHQNVRRRMSVEQVMALMGNKKIPAAPHKALPVITFLSDMTFHLNGDEIQAIPLPPAHTDGDVALYFKKANVLHTGDCLVAGFGYPIIDVGSGGTVDGLIEAHEKLLALVDDNTKIIPGHGPISNKATLQELHDLVKELRGRVAKLVDEGKTLDEAVAAKPTADLDEKWSKGFIKPDMIVKMIYLSLKK
jgi:glyoxylase-like metal-dependent hydrolase (beta-lactamase superfamily II)